MTFQARTTYDVFCDYGTACDTVLEDVQPLDLLDLDWVALDQLDGRPLHFCPEHAGFR